MSTKLIASKSKITIGTFLTLVLSSNSLFAQTVTEKSVFQRWWSDGGWTMWFIALAIFAYIALTIYNAMTLTRGKFVPKDLRAELMEDMTNCRVRSAIQRSANSPSYLGRMLAYSLPNIDASQPEDLGRGKVEDAMADFSINENRKYMVWIGYISLVAQAAPMLGLLGTVIGMVEAFTQLAKGDPDPGKLAASIQVALLTTMWGLITAIPAVFSYFFFKNKLSAHIAEAHNTAEELINASITTINQDSQLARIPEGFAG